MTKICRGKRVDNEKWVQGYFVKKIDPLLRTETCFILVQEYDKSCIDGTPTILKSELTWYRVIPETVGLCTDLQDKNGKLICEGDILRHYNDRHNPERYYTDYVVYDNIRARFCFAKNIGMCFTLHEDCCYEKVGNIHDTPELLKEGANNE